MKRKLILMCTLTAVIVMMLAASAMPASAKAYCYYFDTDDFFLATGYYSEYGGTLCTRESLE